LTNEMNGANGHTIDLLGQRSQVDLTQIEMALIIDALLQAEMTLPLLDQRYKTLKLIESLRFQQLSLANRLEAVLASINRQQDGAHHHPAWASSWRSSQP